MGQRMTEKQLGFCQSVVEGMTASDAYRANYSYKNMKVATIHRRAMELMDNGKVTARLVKLRAEHAKRNAVTVDSLVRELVESRAVAMEDRNPSAANQATHLKARITGNINDKVTISGALTVEQSLAYFKTLGIEPVLIDHKTGESK